MTKITEVRELLTAALEALEAIQPGGSSIVPSVTPAQSFEVNAVSPDTIAAMLGLWQASRFRRYLDDVDLAAMRDLMADLVVIAGVPPLPRPHPLKIIALELAFRRQKEALDQIREITSGTHYGDRVWTVLSQIDQLARRGLL